MIAYSAGALARLLGRQSSNGASLHINELVILYHEQSMFTSPVIMNGIDARVIYAQPKSDASNSHARRPLLFLATSP